MSGEVSAALFTAAAYGALLVACAVPLSGYLVNVMEGRQARARRIIGPVERGAFRLLRVNPDDSMGWRRYLVCVAAFTGVSIAGLFLLLVAQGALPANPEGFEGLPADTALNMAVSFATNTDWQAVAGESHLSYLSQAAGLAVQNFLSPAVGIAVAFALMRGLWSAGDGRLGNFFADVIRVILCVLLPLSLVLSIALASQGVPQTFQGYETVQLLEPVAVNEAGNVVAADDAAAV